MGFRSDQQCGRHMLRFTFGGAGPSRCISSSVLDSPNSSCLNAPEPRRLKQEGVPVFQFLDHLSQSRQSGFP